MAAVVTGIFNPIYLFLSRKMKPSPASLLTCLIIFVLLFVPIVFFVGILSGEAFELYRMGKDAVLNHQIRDLINNTRLLDQLNVFFEYFGIEFTIEQLQSSISEIGKTVGFFLYQQASAIASNILEFLMYFFFMLLISYYLFIDGNRLTSFIVDISPLPRSQYETLIQKFKDIAWAILIGNGLGGLIQGLLGGIVFSIFGFKSAILWGVIMGLLAFLPIVGIGAVFLPAAIILMVKGRIAAGIFFMVFYGILSGCIEYIFKPKLVGKRVKMHTLLVLLSILGGLKLFGILGIIYGPLIVASFLTLTDIYHASYQKIVAPAND
jgi:predicted PurR-regulated permease PerM